MKIVTFLALMLATTAPMAGTDLEACTRDGAPIPDAFCRSLREADATAKRHQAPAENSPASLQRAREALTAARAEQQRQREADKQRAAEARAAAAVEEDYWKGQSKALQASLQASERAAERQEATARKVCGADYGMPRIGMPLARARSCLGDTRLVGQVNRDDGVASVYTNGRVQLYVMADKVVAWQATR
jgi:hypothetical protein